MEKSKKAAKADYKNLDKILDVVSDIYLNPVFPEQEIEKEKGVIVEEINMINDIPQHKVQYEFLKLLYGDQPAGWSIAGPKENILKMRSEEKIELLNYTFDTRKPREDQTFNSVLTESCIEIVIKKVK